MKASGARLRHEIPIVDEERREYCSDGKFDIGSQEILNSMMRVEHDRKKGRKKEIKESPRV
jgi:hypothetical protein